MINNFNFPEGIEWSLNYVSGPDFFSEDFKFDTGEGLFYHYQGSVVKYVDISNATSAKNMFYYCINLSSIPQLDTSNVTNMDSMFQYCESLIPIPQLDTSNVTRMSSMFAYCKKLVSIPQLDTSNVTYMDRMFESCSQLITIPQLDTSNVTNMGSMFSTCSKLRSIPLLDCSKVTSMSTMFGYSNITTLTDLGGFKNLKINCTGNLNLLPNLTIQSLMNVINNLYDFRANGESTTRTLQLGTTNLNKLTDEQKAVATNKGWNLT